MSRDILAYPLPPPVAFGDTFPYPSPARPRVSRIIWMPP